MNVQLNVTGVGWVDSVHEALDLILSAVSEITGVSRRDILGPRRTARIAFARRLSMAASRSITEATFAEIGAFYDRDHSTVVLACGVIAHAAAADPQIAARLEALTSRFQ